MKRNLVGKILGKIKIFVQDFVPIRTALLVEGKSEHIAATVIPGGKHTQQSNDPERSRLASSEIPQQHSSIVHLRLPVIYGGMVALVRFPCMSTDNMCPF